MHLRARGHVLPADFAATEEMDDGSELVELPLELEPPPSLATPPRSLPSLDFTRVSRLGMPTLSISADGAGGGGADSGGSNLEIATRLRELSERW